MDGSSSAITVPLMANLDIAFIDIPTGVVGIIPVYKASEIKYTIAPGPPTAFQTKLADPTSLPVPHGFRVTLGRPLSFYRELLVVLVVWNIVSDESTSCCANLRAKWSTSSRYLSTILLVTMEKYIGWQLRGNFPAAVRTSPAMFYMLLQLQWVYCCGASNIWGDGTRVGCSYFVMSRMCQIRSGIVPAAVTRRA
ncbi:hypothetical protein C8J57DRAFT_1226182 [Mycena rebaudengoi]|nr:hypothetical protein C8J57DRAFT_1226182 [Mycena rebaudengoi]